MATVESFLRDGDSSGRLSMAPSPRRSVAPSPRRQSMAKEVAPTTDIDGNRVVDLAAWRRHSVAMISELIETAVSTHGTTKATLTLCDLAGSEDVGRTHAGLKPRTSLPLRVLTGPAHELLRGKAQAPRD